MRKRLLSLLPFSHSRGTISIAQYVVRRSMPSAAVSFRFEVVCATSPLTNASPTPNDSTPKYVNISLDLTISQQLYGNHLIRSRYSPFEPEWAGAPGQ
jgi:hypothetical protein